MILAALLSIIKEKSAGRKYEVKIALLEPIGVPAEMIEDYGKRLESMGHEFCYYDSLWKDEEELKERSRDCDIIMIANHPCSGEVIEAAQNLKMISVAFTGIDHVGTAVCKAKNIMVCNAAGYSNQTVAELIIGFAVDALRNVVKADHVVRNGGTSASIGGREICGRTVGIIGLGQIGTMAAKLFQAFGAKVIAYNRSQSQEAIDRGITYCSLDEVLEQSDIVSLNLPLNEETRGFLNKERIAKMKPDTVFINCARGPIVDNEALTEALNEDRLGFACIDVFDCEPPIPEDYPLLHAKNTILTPHQAFISEESMKRRAEIVFQNVFAYLKKKPQNVCKL